MFFKSYCCCAKATEKMANKPSTKETFSDGVNNNSFETWDPNKQQNTSSVALEKQPNLMRSSCNSVESLKLSKIDLNLDIFENNRFCDMSEAIHKSNERNSCENIQS